MMDINYEFVQSILLCGDLPESFRRCFQTTVYLPVSCQPVDQSARKKLGITLFIRSTKTVQLTPEGETLLRHIEPAMNLIKRGKRSSWKPAT